VTKNKNVSVLPLEGHGGPSEARDGPSEVRDGPLKGHDGPTEGHLESIKPGKCQYCQKIISRQCRLQRHEDKCRLKNDPIRLIELKLQKDVTLPNDNSCRFCLKSFYNICSLHRHDSTCNAKKVYHESLLKEQQDIPSSEVSTNINTANVLLNRVMQLLKH
jgi:hypothetical protein